MSEGSGISKEDQAFWRGQVVAELKHMNENLEEFGITLSKHVDDDMRRFAEHSDRLTKSEIRVAMICGGLVLLSVLLQVASAWIPAVHNHGG